MNNNNFFNNLPQSTQENLLNPTAKNIGETLGGLTELILSPIDIATTFVNTYMRQYKKSIVDRVTKIPLKNRDPSKINLAMKAVQDSAYQLGDNNLREMFAKLVTASVDKRKNQHLSPRFSNVLSQFSPEDAIFLKQISNNSDMMPTAIFGIEVKKGISTENNEHLISVNDSSHAWISNEFSLDNLIALGVIRQTDEDQLGDDEGIKFYSDIEKSIDYLVWSATQYSISPDQKACIIKGLLSFTTFGKELKNIVLPK